MAATVGALLCEAGARLREAGIENPRAEARRLLAHVLGIDPAALLARAHHQVAAEGFSALVARRAAREPYAHLVGVREFWGLTFRVTPDVLVPRPETETLVEAALQAFPERARVRRVLDLGTGSGCLLCAALAEFPGAFGVGVDASAAALKVARANAGALGLSGRAGFLRGDWHQAIGGGFDLVLCNPPYVAAPGPAAAAQPATDPELAHEPPGALFAGADGLAAYRRLLPGLARLLRPGGIGLLELGIGQAEPASALARAAGLGVGPAIADLAGVARALPLWPPGANQGVGMPFAPV